MNSLEALMADKKVVAVAVIGLIGTLGAAAISNWDKLFTGRQVPPPFHAPEPDAPGLNPVGTRRFTGSMGPLEDGISYNQGDLYDRASGSPEDCANFCYNDDRCIAMTYVKSQQRCWIKSSIGPVGKSPDMVSARRLAQ
jgi:hypothetical protein